MNIDVPKRFCAVVVRFMYALKLDQKDTSCKESAARHLLLLPCPAANRAALVAIVSPILSTNKAPFSQRQFVQKVTSADRPRPIGDRYRVFNTSPGWPSGTF
jgi:hypothetical protein